MVLIDTINDSDFEINIVCMLMAKIKLLISDYLLLDFASEARAVECFELNMYIPDE